MDAHPGLRPAAPADDEGLLAALARQLEEGPEDVSMALQGLGAIPPADRAAVIAGLAEMGTGPGVVEFLRLLSFAHDPMTRAAALEALARPRGSEEHRAAAWATIATEHPDPDVAAQARAWQAGTDLFPLGSGGGLLRPGPRLVRSLVTALDGRGRGFVVLAAEAGSRHVAAAFPCDVRHGVGEVIGQVGQAPEESDAFFADFLGRSERDALEEVPGLALGLLAGSLLLCGPETTPALRFWIEAVVGPDFRPRPFAEPFDVGDPADVPFSEMTRRADEVLDSCPDWLDDSDLTYELAEEIALREGEVPPDPARDAGAYRYLFEHALADRLELDRRMLFWMAAFWHAAGAPELSRSALALGWQLSDAQHAVPGHPFIVALSTRSLAAAQKNLRRGIDLRDPTLRARHERAGWP